LVKIETAFQLNFSLDVYRTLIDLNRAGIPLMEFVFNPDLVDGEEAAALVKELAFTLQLLGVCSGKMEGCLQKLFSSYCRTQLLYTIYYS